MVLVPELPEVEALAQFLRGRTDGHVVTEVAVGAISALKTFRPPPDALVGGTIVDVQRHGKWLDLMVATPTGEPLHLVWHLSRAGWVRWSFGEVGPRSAAVRRPASGRRHAGTPRRRRRRWMPVAPPAGGSRRDR